MMWYICFTTTMKRNCDVKQQTKWSQAGLLRTLICIMLSISLPQKREITSYKRVSINNRWFYLVGFFLSEDHLCYYLFPVEVKIWLPCACVWEQSAMLMPPLVSECAEGAGEEEGWSEEHNGKLHCTPGSCGKEWDFPGGEVVCP